NDGPWTRWKTKGRFPTAPTALGNRKQRNSHIPTAATTRGKVETERHVSHFPAHGFVFVSKTKKGGLAADRFAPAPGSFFDEKMLNKITGTRPCRNRKESNAINSRT